MNTIARPRLSGLVVSALLLGACPPPAEELPPLPPCERAEDWTVPRPPAPAECPAEPCFQPLNTLVTLDGGEAFVLVRGAIPANLRVTVDGAASTFEGVGGTLIVTVPAGGEPRAITPVRMTFLDGQGEVVADLPAGAYYVDRPPIPVPERTAEAAPIAPELAARCARVEEWRINNLGENRFTAAVTSRDPRVEILDGACDGFCVCLSGEPLDGVGPVLEVPLEILVTDFETGERCVADSPSARFPLLPAATALDPTWGNGGVVRLEGAISGNIESLQPVGTGYRGGVLLPNEGLLVDDTGRIETLELVQEVGRVTAGPREGVAYVTAGRGVQELVEGETGFDLGWFSGEVFSFASDLAVAPAGTILVLDGLAVAALTPEGLVRDDYGVSGRAELPVEPDASGAGFEQPRAMAVDEEGRALVVLLRSSNGTARVVRLDASGAVDPTFVTPPLPSDFSPVLAARGDRLWYLGRADATNKLLAELDDDGSLASETLLEGPNEGRSFGLTVDAAGHALVGLEDRAGVVRVAPGGTVVGELGVNAPLARGALLRFAGISAPLACFDDGSCILYGATDHDRYLARVRP